MKWFSRNDELSVISAFSVLSNTMRTMKEPIALTSIISHQSFLTAFFISSKLIGFIDSPTKLLPSNSSIPSALLSFSVDSPNVYGVSSVLRFNTFSSSDPFTTTSLNDLPFQNPASFLLGTAVQALAVSGAIERIYYYPFPTKYSPELDDSGLLWEVVNKQGARSQATSLTTWSKDPLTNMGTHIVAYTLSEGQSSNRLPLFTGRTMPTGRNE
ncbi:hypothetical protein PIB30_036605 [Stylosanthes scabra]|uniref:Uncharacterized protein n=1 Tax=Stylosanthes scabra TaxID=79078 RepID=A0ABU6RDL5_9FABA|nr:hypothetical protein [Stylosanthes scabra]